MKQCLLIIILMLNLPVFGCYYKNIKQDDLFSNLDLDQNGIGNLMGVIVKYSALYKHDECSDTEGILTGLEFEYRNRYYSIPIMNDVCPSYRESKHWKSNELLKIDLTIKMINDSVFSDEEEIKYLVIITNLEKL